MKDLKRILLWVLGEAWEKINFPAVYRELKELGKKHGKRFFWAALVWELIEDVVFPFLSWLMGVPELIPLFLIMHFEPIAYPAIFWGFRMYDRAKGREPWEPDRSAQSSYWRSAGKVVVFQLAVAGWFVAILLQFNPSPRALVAYIALMSAFGFVHERIWHDSNYGIRADDSVEPKRVFAKALTYLIVSTMTLYPLLRASFSTVPWKALLACQSVGLALYLVLEAVWARSDWGVSPVENSKSRSS